MTISRRTFLKLLLAGSGTAVLAACGARPRPSEEIVARATATPIGSPTLSPPRPSAPPPAIGSASATALPSDTPAIAVAPVATGTRVPPATPTETVRPSPTETARPAPTATARPTATPTPRPTATRTPVPAANQKRMWTWLRMTDGQQVPSSEADYVAHANTVDAVLPLNGGKLQADGTWLQEANKIMPRWPHRLNDLARANGQLYMPGVGNDSDGLPAVLDNPGRHARVAAELVKLATEGRYDSPWDGVFLDLEAIPGEYQQRMTRFLNVLGRAVRDAGLALGISVGATSVNNKAITDPAFDLGVVRELADAVDLRCYDYWGPVPRSIGPYWWMEGVVQYALAGGLAAGKIIMGQANYSRHWPNARGGNSREMTFAQAMAFVQENGAKVEWLDTGDYGPVRERIAQIGNGYVVIHDGDTYQQGLNIIQQYGLLGSTVFVPGMGDDRHWQVISAWRAGNNG